MSYWRPTSCSVQLQLSASRGSVLDVGDVYQGTSVIRYRREALPPRSDASTEVFHQQLRKVAEMGGLHVHACTTAPSQAHVSTTASRHGTDAVFPLTVSSYRVTGRRGWRVNEAIKVISVMNGAMPNSAVPSSSPSTDATSGKKGARTAKTKPGKKKNESEMEALAEPAGESAEDAGSKVVCFESGGEAPDGAEVELLVTFTGKLQHPANGGLYAIPQRRAILTHFEVTLARTAFPCPDHPQYRVMWQLKTLQLPDAYQTIITNGDALASKDLPQQSLVQHSFQACGPMAAYVFAFAAFAAHEDNQELLCSETTLQLPTQTHDGSSLNDAETEEVPLRVFTDAGSGVSIDTLSYLRDRTCEALPLLHHFFGCPIPRLQSSQLIILVGPTVPYIAGMEHHCCIFLNESVYAAGRGGANKKTSSSGVSEQLELLVHELAHHWAGNYLGLTFAVKEGLCQLLEQCLGDRLQGKPMRRYPKRGHEGIQETVSGKEFTGHSYQHALLSMQNLVADAGFDVLQQRVQTLLTIAIARTAEAEDQHGWCDEPLPYISTEAFMEHVTNLTS